jgi:hypothetical protein
MTGIPTISRFTNAPQASPISINLPQFHPTFPTTPDPCRQLYQVHYLLLQREAVPPITYATIIIPNTI